mmetsp:Transcript_7472/g.11186  ORF Transcript_7472/g.11186 Transcript_7472/m.11186 type:complete len:83 (+) Transcript_7472:81-329(+)
MGVPAGADGLSRELKVLPIFGYLQPTKSSWRISVLSFNEGTAEVDVAVSSTPQRPHFNNYVQFSVHLLPQQRHELDAIKASA